MHRSSISLPMPPARQPDMNYKEYLASEDWKQKKHLKRSKSKNRCAICGDTENLDMHHLNYRNLTDVVPSDLRRLCRRCHFLGHRLYKEGKFKFKNDNHHSRLAIFKSAVKKELGVSTQNAFPKAERDDEKWRKSWRQNF